MCVGACCETPWVSKMHMPVFESVSMHDSVCLYAYVHTCIHVYVYVSVCVCCVCM